MKSAVIVLLSILLLKDLAASDARVAWQPSPSFDADGQDLERGQMMSYDQEDDEQEYPPAGNFPASIQRSVYTTKIFKVNPMTSGAVEVVYRTTDNGRISLYFMNNKRDILIVVDVRFKWNGQTNIMAMDSKPANQRWQGAVYPRGFPFPCCGYVTTVTMRVEITNTNFVISANGIVIAKRGFGAGLRPPVNEIRYVYEDQGASSKAKLESLTIDY